MALLTQIFHAAQTFFVDPSLVNDARTADISSIDLYFKFKPDVNLNAVGVAQPGVTIFIAETMYGVPRITRNSGLFTAEGMARVNISDVLTSSDATVPTTFRFPIPFTVETNKEYALIIRYDQLAQYELWKTVQGEVLTGTTDISPGPSNKFIGKYFDFQSVFVAEDDTNLDEYLKNWRQLSDTSLKFGVRIARYSHGSVPVAANGSIDADDIIFPNPRANLSSNSTGLNFNVNFGSYEFLSFNENKSRKGAFVGGQHAYQNTVFFPGGPSHLAISTNSSNTVITANSQYPNGANFAWSDIFPTQTDHNFVVLTNGTTTNVRRVTTIVSNTVAQLDEQPTFTNTNAKMMITPVGVVSSFNKSAPFGVEDAFLMLGESSANSTVRFVNNTIEAVAVTAGGSGYSNGDVLYVKGYEEVANKVTGGYVAVANLSTNTTGGIETVYLSNLGCGFVNTSTMEVVIANSTQIGNTTSNTTAGSGATFNFTVGATVRTEYGNNIFKEVVVQNLDIGEFIPYSRIDVPPGTNYTLRLETNYVRKDDAAVFGGYSYYVNPNAGNNQLQLTMYDINNTEELGETPAIPSKSNEFHIRYEDTSVNDKVSNSGAFNSESIRIVSDLSSNSDYSIVRLSRPSIQFSKYLINNDATNEHTDSGNAHAKHLTTVIPFTRTSEDVRVYLTAYKPSNTDIKVYARIYKNEDPEAFDDKNWTLLELKDGTSVVSSASDINDYIELTYGFYQVPPDRTELDGVVTLTSGNTTVIGVGTDFSTDLAAGDLVHLYQPLFPENHIITAVESVTNTTAIVLDQSTTNTSLLAEGMKIEKITYPMQAFNNKQNDNVVRYYNSSSASFDGYESLAIKMVYLSDSPHRIPRVDDLKVTGVSA